MEDRQFCKWTGDPAGGGIAEFTFPDGETTYARFTDFSHFLCLSSSIQHQLNMRDDRIAKLEEWRDRVSESLKEALKSDLCRELHEVRALLSNQV